MKTVKRFAKITAVLLLTLAASCQDHHFVSYDKMGPLPEPVPPSKQSKAAPSIQQASPYQTPAQTMQAAPKVQPGFTGLIASGVVELSPEAIGSAPPGWTLYIIARPVEGGAAVAAKRVDKPVFPVSFELTEQDLMIGQPTSGMKLSVEARYDADGDPITKGKDDFYGKADGELVVGAKNTLVRLKKQAG